MERKDRERGEKEIDGMEGGALSPEDQHSPWDSMITIEGIISPIGRGGSAPPMPCYLNPQPSCQSG